MSQANLNSLIENLDSQQVEQQIPAIEETAKIIETLAQKAVAALENSPNRFLVAERLNRFGSIIIPYLEQLIDRSKNSEVKILAALILLQQNSKAGIFVLLNALESDLEYAGLAAQHLATAGIKDTIEPICDRLRNTDFEEIDLIVSLLDSLCKLNAELPQDLFKRFNRDDTPWQIKTMCQDSFSHELNNIEEDVNVYLKHLEYITTSTSSQNTQHKKISWVPALQQGKILDKQKTLLTYQ